MKILPRLFLGYTIGVIVFMFVMFLFDGDEFDWKKNLIIGLAAGIFTMSGLYFFRTKKGD